MKHSFSSQSGQAAVAFAALLVIAIVVYGLYLQAGGHGDIFNLLFSSARSLCETAGNIRDAAGNCIAR
jgi:hypothetical protein